MPIFSRFFYRVGEEEMSLRTFGRVLKATWVSGLSQGKGWLLPLVLAVFFIAAIMMLSLSPLGASLSPWVYSLF